MDITLTSRARRTALAVAAVGALLTASAPAALGAPPAPLAFVPCGDGLDCATLTVPVDHGDPAGGTVELPVLRHRATDPAQRAGVLLVNPGGPGAPAADHLRQLTGTFPGIPATLGEDVLARYDVIALDPRGTSGPGAVRCLTDEQREAAAAADLDPDVPGGRDRAAALGAARELAEGCRAGNDQNLLAQVATDDVARDMDALRAALGEERISYLGVSYGTLLGATYATLFPQRVRHMVLDSPVHPVTWQQRPLEALRDQIVSGERVLEAYFRTCAEEGDACPFGAGRPGEAFDALVDRLEAEPLAVPAGPAGPGGRLDGAGVTLAARTAVFDRRLWPVLTQGLLAAQAGDGSILHALTGALIRDPDGTINGFAEANVAVNCLDKNFPRDPAVHAERAVEGQRLAPRTGALVGYGFLACTEWPVRTDERFTGPYTAEGAPPILVLATTNDSQTPYPWARAMVRGLDDATLLTVEGFGHGAYGISGACVDDAVDRYLLSGDVPAGARTCAQQPPATAAPAGPR